jgi:uncharacterized protein (TIGR02145 family)
MKFNYILILITLLFSSISCQNSSDENSNWVKIGALTWSNKNLDIDTLNSGVGVKIDYAKDANTWMQRNKYNMPAYCYYNFDEKNKIFGKLYNVYAVARLAPQGTHIATKEEWNNLINLAGGAQIAGARLKSKDYWLKDKLNNDEYGFSVLPGGSAYYGSRVDLWDTHASFWAIEIFNRLPNGDIELNASRIKINNEKNYNSVEFINLPQVGMSVRLVKDY